MTIDFASGRLDKCVLQLQQATGYSFAYETSGLQTYEVKPMSFKEEKLQVVLEQLLQGSGYIFEERHHVILIGPAAGRQPGKRPLYQFNGVIEDKQTGEVLKGVAISLPGEGRSGTFTNQDGYFSLTSPSDTLKLRLSYLSYKPVEVVLQAADAPLVRIRMDVAPSSLDSVLVGDPDDVVPVSPLSRVSPPINRLFYLPRFCGDVDLISMLKITPGIQEANDGSGSLIVRGGAPDQNLLLLDDANVFNATHLFGLVSTVNVNAVENLEIYKGAFPARYSGRISSVWDVGMKDGDPQQLHGALSVGTFASDIMLEGPIIKDKTTFMIAARKSYHDIYVRLFTPGVKLQFQDMNIKLHHRFSDKDHLYLSGYASKDIFNLNSDTFYAGGNNQTTGISFRTTNKAASLRWRHDYSPRLTTNLSILYSTYNLDAGTDFTLEMPGRRDPDVQYWNGLKERATSGVYDIGGKWDAHYQLGNNHDIEAGLYYTHHKFDPYHFTKDWALQDPALIANPPPNEEEIIRDSISSESGLYLEDHFNIASRWTASAGLHFNRYVQNSKTYLSLQPRINVRYELHPGWFLYGAYVKMQQNVHRLSASQTSLPIDTWIPSTDKLKPQVSNQVSLGVSGVVNGLFDFSVESYYKGIKDVAELLLLRLVDSAEVTKNTSWDKEVATGKGAAYGIEISLRRTKGNFTGWFSYALSWSNRTLPEINNGLTFPYKYDRRHNLNLVALYKLGKTLELSGVFSFQSKPQAPVPIIRTSDLSYDAELVKEYAATTEQRAYHRLDLGISWLNRYSSRLHGTWNLSVLNVYNRANAFYYFSRNNNNQLDRTVLLPVSVILTYTLSF
ncbi:TonB-dependent receptor [Taibaiella koreensis]|uniref:TonB-dependent receptor n=1 Tax=Taibaiella koreensis TaxID=1268548 RepID=UPI0013C338EB|nr:TonB-dependent receptor [Taibaiella koreensis]